MLKPAGPCTTRQPPRDVPLKKGKQVVASVSPDNREPFTLESYRQILGCGRDQYLPNVVAVLPASGAMRHVFDPKSLEAWQSRGAGLINPLTRQPFKGADYFGAPSSNVGALQYLGSTAHMKDLWKPLTTHRVTPQAKKIWLFEHVNIAEKANLLIWSCVKRRGKSLGISQNRRHADAALKEAFKGVANDARDALIHRAVCESIKLELLSPTVQLLKMLNLHDVKASDWRAEHLWLAIGRGSTSLVGELLARGYDPSGSFQGIALQDIETTPSVARQLRAAVRKNRRSCGRSV